MSYFITPARRYQSSSSPSMSKKKRLSRPQNKNTTKLWMQLLAAWGMTLWNMLSAAANGQCDVTSCARRKQIKTQFTQQTKNEMCLIFIRFQIWIRCLVTMWLAAGGHWNSRDANRCNEAEWMQPFNEPHEPQTNSWALSLLPLPLTRKMKTKTNIWSNTMRTTIRRTHFGGEI